MFRHEIILYWSNEDEVSLSWALEETLVARWARQRRRDWIESNRTAIRSYNRRVEAKGSYGDWMRRF